MSDFNFGDLIEPLSNLLVGEFEPQRKNRYIMSIEGVNLPAFVCRNVDKPKLNINKTTYDWMNKKVHFAGKGEWQDINMTLVNPIAPNAADAVMAWIRQSWDNIIGTGGYATQYKKNITITSIGPVGEQVEQWKLRGAFITNADFGGKDASDDNFDEVTLTISIDDAELN